AEIRPRAQVVYDTHVLVGSPRRGDRRARRPAVGDGLRDRFGLAAAGRPLLRHRRGFAISALGGSMTQIGGPTGAFVVVVFGIVATYGVDGLFVCTLMAGVLLI